MAGYGPPPGPYVGFQPTMPPVGFEIHQSGYPPNDNRPGYPNPPPQDIYYPSTNEYNSFSNPPISVPSDPSYHRHGYENFDNLPPVGFERVGNSKDEDSATASGVKLDDRGTAALPIFKGGSDIELNVGSSKVCNIL